MKTARDFDGDRASAKKDKVGTTLVQPHRDEWKLFLQDKEVRLFGSEGEQRSAVAALRFAEWERMQQEEELYLPDVSDRAGSLVPVVG